MRRDATGWGFQGAEGAEIDNHEKNESWRYELLSRKPANRQLVKLTWVFKVKRDGRKKARLCVQGCTQRPGVDYDQTFCAAMRGGSLRLLSSIGGRLGLSMRRWDFVAAYLQGELEPGEVTYCSPPPGYTTAEVDGHVRLVTIGQGDVIRAVLEGYRPLAYETIPASIESSTDKSSLICYPNPSSGLVNIDFGKQEQQVFVA